MNTVQKGKAAEFVAISKLLMKGFNVFPSIAEDSFIDLIYLEPSGKLNRSQVKSFYKGSKGEYHFSVTKTHVTAHSYVKRRYTNEFIDNFIAVDLITNNVYIIPLEFINKYKCAISLKTIKTNFESL